MTTTETEIFNQPLAAVLAEPSKIGTEISITGKWVPRTPNGLFRKSTDSREMLREWADIHAGAKADPGILATEINHAVGADAVLVHHTFRDAAALDHYFSTTATQHMAALSNVAMPERHLVRGLDIPVAVTEAVLAKGVPATFGRLAFGYVRHAYQQPDRATAIEVTAKWTCKSRDRAALAELKHWWQRVGTDAHAIEKGLRRYEVYEVSGENALIIHETFENTKELQFHLAKGTAHKYKSEIDKIAAPECYFFRGPVSWTIRTYSKFLHLPATYSSLGSHFTRNGGSMIDGVAG